MSIGSYRFAHIAAAGLAVSVSSVASADQVFYDWTGAVSTLWSNSGNWDPVGLPNTAGEVALFHGGSTCDLDISVTLDKLGNGIGDTLNMLNDRDLTIMGTTETGGDAPTGLFSIFGVVNMQATLHATDIAVQGDRLTLGNSAHLPSVVNMSDSPNNRFRGVFGTETIVFDTGLLVRGSGQIGVNTLQIINYGTIRADQSTDLVLDPSAAGFSNLGEIAAESGATLRLDTGTYDNTGGLIVARNGSVVLLNGAALVGSGSIQTFGTGVIRVNTVGTATSLDSQTVSGTLELPNDRDILIVGPTFVGALNVQGTIHDTRLSIDGPVTFSGTINMSNTSTNVIASLGGALTGDHLTLSNATIRGSGQIGINTLDFVNHSNIIADQPNVLAIDPASDFFNSGTGLLLAQGGGTLRLDGGTYDNQGAIAANDGSVVQMNGCAINGLLSGSGSGYFDVLTVGTSTRVHDVVLNGPLNLSNDRDVWLQGLVVNNASINMGGTIHDTRLYIDGPVTFTGGGTINLSNSTVNVFSSLGGGLPDDFLYNHDNLIRGSGQIGINTLDILNQGVMRADYSGSVLIIDPAVTCTNQGTIEAVNGGIIQLTTGNFQNEGLISATGASRVDLNSCSLDGSLFTDATSFFSIATAGTSTELHDISLTGRLAQSNDRDVLVRGTITHAGDWDLQGTVHDTRVYIDGPVTFTGGGTLNMSNSTVNVFSTLGGGLAGDFLTIDNYTIHGAGQLGINALDVFNAGTISADSNAGLIIDPASTFTNTGLVQAVAQGILRLDSGTHDHTAGLLALHDQSRCDLNACTITGNLTSDGDAYFNVVTAGASTLLSDVHLTGRLVQSNDRDLLVRGTLTHAGDWDIQGTIHDTRIHIDGSVTLTGGGVMNLSATTTNVISDLSGGLPGDFLTIADYTIRGSGQFGINALNFNNAGTIIADQSVLLILDPASGMVNTGTLQTSGSGGMRLDSGAYSSSGLVIVDANSKLDLTSGSFTQTAGQTIVNGEFESDPNLLTFSAGSVSGAGLLDSNIANTGAIFAPGNSIGTLSVEGNYTQGAAAALEVELALGSSDRLAVTGVATMDGFIRALVNPGYVPLVGDEFVILTAASVAGVTPTLVTVNFPLGRDLDLIVEPVQIRLVVVLGCVADWNADSQVNFFDVQGYLNAFSAHQPLADLNDDGFFNFFDVQAFLNAFSGGCP